MSALFEPLDLRDLHVTNRIWVSPMCQYSARDGLPLPWHLVHLGGFAVGGAGLVITEATAVRPEGRISPADTGLWNDEQATAWTPIVEFVHEQGRPIAVQLAHAGRKASTPPPWLPPSRTLPPAEGGWTPVSPSGRAFGALAAPRQLTSAELTEITESFVAAAERARRAGFDAVELHFAHGYFGHQFYSPLINDRSDEYSGDFDGRTRWLLETTQAVRAAWPDDLPLLVRLSVSDWVEGGWTPEDSVKLAGLLAGRGVDLVDCSSGGAVPDARVPLAPGYQVPLARAVRAGAGVPVGAVGLITEPTQAEQIVALGDADAVLLGRALLGDPHWPLRAAAELGGEISWPVQYERARPR